MTGSLLNRRMMIVTLLGFSSGLPLALTGTLLQAWMKTRNVDLRVIGLFALVGTPYTLKFLWSPVMDRFAPPFLGSRLGRRRGWILLTQLALVASIGIMAFLDPAKFPVAIAAVAVWLAFASASQDIVVDAYKTDLLEENERGPGAAAGIVGYRVAMLVSGGLALILADHLSFTAVYLIMALGLGVCILATLAAPEPARQVRPPQSLTEAVALPLQEFWSRKGALEMMGFIVLYKLDAVMAVALTTPFMMDLGFSLTDIGTVIKTFGLAATIGGTVFGGALMVRLGLLRSLWIFGILQGVSNLTFMALAHFGHHYPLMVASVAIENICSGMGNAALAAFFMSLCDRRFTATQYALLSSLMALTRVFAGAPTGYLVKAVGWEQFFLICTLAMIPGLLLLTRFSRWSRPAQG